jgi:hypothetical protein
MNRAVRPLTPRSSSRNLQSRQVICANSLLPQWRGGKVEVKFWYSAAFFRILGIPGRILNILHRSRGISPQSCHRSRRIKQSAVLSRMTLCSREFGCRTETVLPAIWTVWASVIHEVAENATFHAIHETDSQGIEMRYRFRCTAVFTYA